VSRRKNYFNETVDEAIERYNNSTNPVERSELYETHIMFAVSKIAENLIHKHKFHNSENENLRDTIHEVNCFVLEKIDKIDSDKGKPFSYLTKMIFIYLINQSRKAYNRKLNKAELSEVDECDLSNGNHCYNEYDFLQSHSDDFTPKFVSFMKKNRDLFFVGKKDVITSNAILEILQYQKNLDFFDKKSIYIYIRNLVKVSPQRVGKILKTMKDLYNKLKDEYDNQFIDYSKKEEIYEQNNNDFGKTCLYFLENENE